MDPRVETEKYLKQHGIAEVLQNLMAELLFHKPENPSDFICSYLKAAQQTGVVPLLSETDLGTVFAMYDICSRGAVTAEQANSALQSILGEEADLQLKAAPHKLIDRVEFIKLIQQALHRAHADVARQLRAGVGGGPAVVQGEKGV